MDYVGWRGVQSALRYVEAAAPFGDWARRAGLVGGGQKGSLIQQRGIRRVAGHLVRS
ncbi:hypothetical protein D3C76_1346990 [compost metagenome]